MSALWFARCGVVREQAAVSVQALPPPHNTTQRHGDARPEVAVPLLVHSHALADGNEEKYIDLKDMFTEHCSQVISPKDIGRVLPWVHITIANAKTLMADMYHGVKPEFLQEYLNEFCYKFNRRYFGECLFDRLVIIAVSYRTDFKHRRYNKKAA